MISGQVAESISVFNRFFSSAVSIFFDQYFFCCFTVFCAVLSTRAKLSALYDFFLFPKLQIYLNGRGD